MDIPVDRRYSKDHEWALVDADGSVLHTELVPEIAQEPDYDAAVAALG